MDRETLVLLKEFYIKLAESQENLDIEFAQIIEDNFKDLIDNYEKESVSI